MIEEITKEIIEIVKQRQKHRKQHGDCYWISRKYSKARLQRLRLVLNELLRNEERM